ncbi:MAG: prenyltransferase/squalene oxidase repeat-containing protein [Planctomycetota bacterium]
MNPTQAEQIEVVGEEPPEPEDPFPAGYVHLIALVALAVTLLCMPTPRPVQAQESTSAEESTSVRAGASRRAAPAAQSEAAVLRAIEDGLDFLAGEQKDGGKFSNTYPVAITSLAGMAFVGAGVQYDRGKHGVALGRAVRYLLDVQPEGERQGYLTDPNSRMHGHAYAMLFLTQVLGTMPSPTLEKRLRERVRAGIKVIARSQTTRGGWGYTPGDEFDEASITVCCLQALRAAKDAGIEIQNPNLKSVVDGAVRYLKDSCLEDGSFRYSLARNVDRPSYELTAAAVSTLDAAGQYAAKEHARGIAYMRRVLESYRDQPLSASSRYLYYGNLYAAQVFHQEGGEVWDAWLPAARRQLLAERKSGHSSWDDQKFGPEYATAVALLILEVPLAYLPIFER